MNSPSQRSPTRFKERKLLFHKGKIPEEYVTPQIDSFIEYIPLISEDIYNKSYIKSTLAPHFESAYNQLSEIIDDLSEMIKEVTATMKSATESENYQLNIKKSFLNAKCYREFKIIYPLFKKHYFSLNATRLLIIKQRHETLTSLQNLCKYLIDNPHYVRINLNHALISWKALEFDCMPTVFQQYRAFSNKIDDLYAQLNFIPRPFEDIEGNRSLFNRIVAAHLQLRDPVTKYIPYTDEYEIISEFLISKKSPINIGRMKTIGEQHVQSMIEEFTEKLIKWGKIKSGARGTILTIKTILVRLIFEKFGLYMKNYGMASESLAGYIEELSTYSLRELGLTLEHIPKEYIDQKPDKLFSEVQVLFGFRSQLIGCLFATNPIDAAFAIHRASQMLSGILASVRDEKLEQSQRFDDLFYLWKAGIVASEIPEPDRLFQWISKWKHLEAMPSAFVEAIRIPRSVVKNLLSEALSISNK